MPCTREVRRHKWGKWLWVAMTHGGVQKRTCSRCGKKEMRGA